MRRNNGAQGQKADGIITPVIFQALVQQRAIIREGVDGQQFDRGNAKALDIINRRLVTEAFERAAQFLRNGGIELCEALDMGFIDNRIGPGDLRTAIIAPIDLIGIHDPAFGHESRAVEIVEGQILVRIVEMIAEHFGRPPDIAHQFAGIRIEQQLVMIEAMAVLGLERSMDTEAVEGARLQARYKPVPDFIGVIRQIHPGDLNAAAGIVEAQLDAIGVGGKQGKINPFARVAGTQPLPLAGKNFEVGRLDVHGRSQGLSLRCNSNSLAMALFLAASRNIYRLYLFVISIGHFGDACRLAGAVSE